MYKNVKAVFSFLQNKSVGLTVYFSNHDKIIIILLININMLLIGDFGLNF